MIGLYDRIGILRFAACDHADCMAYAEFFGLQDDDFILEPLLMACSGNTEGVLT